MEILVDKTTNIIKQFGEGLSSDDSSLLIELTDDELTTYRLLPSHNGSGHKFLPDRSFVAGDNTPQPIVIVESLQEQIAQIKVRLDKGKL